jgi:antitoxin ParD1/3/4
MDSMHVDIPDRLRKWVEEQVRTGKYADASDYVRSLIRRDQASRRALIELLDEAASSGVSTENALDVARAAKASLKNG